jgi:putative DNA-invertase from lambdoid prophage Rac
LKYRSLQESFIDTTNEFGDLLAAFVAKNAELERKRIHERIRAGLEKARADGVALGRPRVIVNREKVWSLRDQGKSVRHIAGVLRLSHGTVQCIVQVSDPDSKALSG